MNDSKIILKLQGVFREIFDEPGLELHDKMTADEVESWDSLAHIDLIIAVEEAFDINIPMLKAAQLNDVGELLRLIEGQIKV